MQVNIIEQFIKGKSEDYLCEDLIFTGKRFFAVVDGATSKHNFLIEGKSTGKFAAELVKVGLLKLDQNKEKLSIELILETITNEFIKVYKKSFKEVNKQIKMTASAAIYDSFEDKIYVVGDPKIALLNNQNEWLNFEKNHKIDDINSLKRSKKIKRLIEEDGYTVEQLLENDLGRQHIMGDLLKQSDYQNNPKSPFSYWVFDGSYLNPKKIDIIDTKDCKEIILASDGYLKIEKSLEEAEKHLLEVLQNDPLLYKEFKSTKGLKKGNHSFDDRSYLKLQKVK